MFEPASFIYPRILRKSERQFMARGPLNQRSFALPADILVGETMDQYNKRKELATGAMPDSANLPRPLREGCYFEPEESRYAFDMGEQLELARLMNKYDAWIKQSAINKANSRSKK